MSPAEASRTFCFDLDGTLCTNTYGDYEAAEPFPWAIARLNALARAGNRVIIFTARGSSTGVDWGPTTRSQLERWSVEYDELRLGKPTADVFVDDRAYPADSWRWGHTTIVSTRGADDAFSHAQHLGIAGLPPPHDVVALETGRTYGGTARWLDEHLARLLDHARQRGVELDERLGEIRDTVVAAANPGGGLLGDAGDVMYALTVSGDRNPAFLDLYQGAHYPVVAVSCRPLQQTVSAATAFGVSVVQGDGNGASHVAVRAGLRARPGPMSWPLRMGAGGVVRDGLGGAVMALHGEKLVVSADGGADTMILARVLEVASRIGVRVDSSLEGARGLARSLTAAQEVVLVNEPFCLLPVVELDGAVLSGGRAGPVAIQLQRAIAADLGFDHVRQAVHMMRD